MIVVHHLNNSRSQRILWLLEELNLPYKIKFYERDKKTMLAPKALQEIHPLGKSPILTDAGITVAESGAIIEYLIEKYDKGKLRPPLGTSESRQYVYWLHYAEGSAMSPLLLSLIFSKIESTPLPFFARPVLKMISNQVKKVFIRPQLKLHFDFIEQSLKKSLWFAGAHFSAADIQMSFPLEASLGRSLQNSYPHIQEFVKKIRSRPAYIKALEKGGPFVL